MAQDKDSSEQSASAIVLPLLPLRNTVLFPGLILPLRVSRSESQNAVEASLSSESKGLLVFTLREKAEGSGRIEDLYSVGTRAIIKKMARKRADLDVVVQGVERVKLVKFTETMPHLRAEATPFPFPKDERPEEVDALHRNILELAEKLQSIAQPETEARLRELLSQIKNPMGEVYLLASLFSFDLEKEQALLSATTRAEAMKMMSEYLKYELQVLELRKKIADSATEELTRQQRDYVLRQQMQAIQKELGEDGEKSDINLLRERLQKANLPETMLKEADRELKKLERLSSAAPDYQVTRSYLELVIELPWGNSTEDNLDLAHARQILDNDHYDLKDVKERIIEHLGVMNMNPKTKAPILCFVGPPGVGKTSLGESIARALGRKFERTSLGGMHDEAELRGHRRTYIGAMPGRVLQAIRRAQVNNPLLMLDEVDKLGRDYRGDPSAALMEILDPSQNHSFRDNYLDLPFDLSRVFFITTANTLDTIARPLLDRMEVLRLSGYTEEEKGQIARRYLIPRQLESAGLNEKQLQFGDEVLRSIIRDYTREAGVRELDRSLARIARKVATQLAQGKTALVALSELDLRNYLGPKKFFLERARKELPPGVATGLAWTETGGEVLFVEAILVPEERGLTLTGSLGDVMKESAQAARSYIRAQAEKLSISKPQFSRFGVHIHIPAGAIPKDGPSAGITLATAMASLYLGIPVRADTAMTGEITLSGLVLPVGGIKEKVLAARRAGLTRVILPKENEKDLVDLPKEILESVEFLPVEKINEAFEAAIPEISGKLTESPPAEYETKLAG